jgi:malonyl-CoA O-methyltransferase
MTGSVKQLIANSFSQAASHYDQAAGWQRQVGKSLWQQAIPYLPNQSASYILDLGCGTGQEMASLTSYYPQATVLGLDLAQGMVRYAKTHQRELQSYWLCADADLLPLANDSFDIIYSNLALQWMPCATISWQEILRVLKPRGLLIFSTLGSKTLRELHQAWQTIDGFHHVNLFSSLSQLTDDLINTGYRCYLLEPRLYKRQYANLKQLFSQLKHLGANQVTEQKPSGLMGKSRWQQLNKYYERWRQPNGQLMASFEVFYGIFSKAD